MRANINYLILVLAFIFSNQQITFGQWEFVDKLSGAKVRKITKNEEGDLYALTYEEIFIKPANETEWRPIENNILEKFFMTIPVNIYASGNNIFLVGKDDFVSYCIYVSNDKGKTWMQYQNGSNFRFNDYWFENGSLTYTEYNTLYNKTSLDMYGLYLRNIAELEGNRFEEINSDIFTVLKDNFWKLNKNKLDQTPTDTIYSFPSASKFQQCITIDSCVIVWQNREKKSYIYQYNPFTNKIKEIQLDTIIHYGNSIHIGGNQIKYENGILSFALHKECNSFKYSIDHGLTWISVPIPKSTYCELIGDDLYIARNNKLYVSKDLGLTFTDASDGLSHFEVSSFQCNNDDLVIRENVPQSHYTTYFFNENNHQLEEMDFLKNIEWHFSNDGKYYAFFNRDLHYYNTTTQNWTNANFVGENNNIKQLFSVSNRFFINKNNQTFTSISNSNDWQLTNLDPIKSIGYADNKFIAIVGQSVHTSIDGVQWTYIFELPPPILLEFDYEIYTLGNNFYIYDGVSNWYYVDFTINNFIPIKILNKFRYKIAIISDKAALAYGENDSNLYVFDGSTAEWNVLNNFLEEPIEYLTASSEYIYKSSYNGIFRIPINRVVHTIDDNNSNVDIQPLIRPNPSSNLIYIPKSRCKQDNQVIIRSVNGQMIKHSELLDAGNDWLLDISRLPIGQYYIGFFDNNDYEPFIKLD